MAGFLSSAIAAIGSSSIGSALVRIIVAYGVSRLINKATGDQNQTAVDEGVRLQLQPDTTNPIPLLYGSAYYSGKITDAQLTNNNKTMWTCLTLSEHTATNRLSDNAAVSTFIDEVYFDSQRVTFKADGITVDYVTNSDGTVDTSARDLVKIYLYKNGSNAPVLPTGITATLPGAAYTLFPGWDSTWTMTNLTFALVKVDYNRDKGITGIPTLKFKVSNTLYKPGDALYDYMTNTVSGAGLPASQIDTASLIALNDYADDEVNFFNEDTGTTETLADRYQINGIINPQKNVLSNLQEIANSTGVYINYDITTGKWGVIIDKDNTVRYNFNDSNIVGGIDVTATSLDSMYNSVEVSFPSRLIQDQTDTITIALPTEFKNANEPVNKLSISLSMLNEPVQARELAYLALYQNRQDRVITFNTDYSKIDVAAGDVITLTNSVYGFTNQPFRVIRVKEIESDAGSILVEIVAQEYDSTLYTAGGTPRRPRTPSAPISLPSLGVIATPAAPTVTTANNNRQPSILLTGVVPSGVVDRFEFWYSTDNWTTSVRIHEEKNANGAPFNSSTNILTRVATLPAGSYRFKVRAGNEQSFSNLSDSSTELVWDPVQTTDAVTENTNFSFEDLLPILGAGAIAYFAYKALYPELVAALSNTELGQLLGIEDPEEAAQIADQLDQESAAFRIVTAGGVAMTPEVDNSLTFIAGDGIEIAVGAGTHDITISATGAGGGFDTIAVDGQDSLQAAETSGTLTLVAGTGISITTDFNTGTITIENPCCADTPVYPEIVRDFGVPKVNKIDYCELTTQRPSKIKVSQIPEVPAVPDSWAIVTGNGTWYDPCYKTNVGTIVISDPQDILDMDIGQTKEFSVAEVPVTSGVVDLNVSYVPFTAKIKLKKVTSNNYVAIKNWDSNTGSSPLITPTDCSASPDSRPLFPSVDYPDGYELCTYANLTPVLAAGDGGLRFIIKKGTAAIPATTVTKTYPGITDIVRPPRICIEEYTVTDSYKAIEFSGHISGTLLFVDAGSTNIFLGTKIGGTRASALGKTAVIAGTVVTERLSNYLFRINNEHPVIPNPTSSSNAVTLYYWEPQTIRILATEVEDIDYNLV